MECIFIFTDEIYRSFNENTFLVATFIDIRHIIDNSQNLPSKYSNDLSVGLTLNLVTLVSMAAVKEELAKLNSVK